MPVPVVVAAWPWVLGALGVGAVGGTLFGIKVTDLTKLALAGGVVYFLIKKR